MLSTLPKVFHKPVSCYLVDTEAQETERLFEHAVIRLPLPHP